MFTLYAAPGSCSLCAHVALIETGVEHEVRYVVLRSPSSPLPAVNPLGRVPTLLTPAGETITQSTVVLPFIADLEPLGKLLSREDPAARRQVLQWLGFFNSDVHPAIKMIAGPERVSSDPEAVRRNYYLILADLFRIVEGSLGKSTWLTGEAMTIADIYGCAAFNWARRFGMTLDGFPRYRAMAELFESRQSVRDARVAEQVFVTNRTRPVPFMSPEWLAMATEEISIAIDLIPSARAMRLSLTEHYSDLPADAPRPRDGSPAFRMAIADGKVDLRYGVVGNEPADVQIQARWTEAWQSVSTRHGPELDAFNAKRLAENSLVIRGSLGGLGSILGRVHDKIADRTIPPRAK